MQPAGISKPYPASYMNIKVYDRASNLDTIIKQVCDQKPFRGQRQGVGFVEHLRLYFKDKGDLFLHGHTNLLL